MNSVVIAVFPTRSQADSALAALQNNGFQTKDISIITRDNDTETTTKNSSLSSTSTNVAEGTVSGIATGGVLGGLAGLLVGIGAITIPGIGALFIAGPLASALGLTGAAAVTASGAITGALAGGLMGALVGLGIPEQDARVYEEHIRSGGLLLAVPSTADNVQQIENILASHNASTIRRVNTPNNP